MIYFEFAICRDPNRNDTELETTTAEFMFDSEDPGDCTRRAAVLLKSRGWRAMSVRRALEAFTREAFGADHKLSALYDSAESGGVGYCLNTRKVTQFAPEELV